MSLKIKLSLIPETPGCYLLKDEKEKIIYVEIGCYNGGSACLALTNNKVECYSIDLGIPIDKQETIKTINDLRPNSKHVYIEGDSQKIEIFNLLKSSLSSK